jgi:hypothetical protein
MNVINLIIIDNKFKIFWIHLFIIDLFGSSLLSNNLELFKS